MSVLIAGVVCWGNAFCVFRATEDAWWYLATMTFWLAVIAITGVIREDVRRGAWGARGR